MAEIITELAEQTIENVEQSDKRPKRINGHTPNWWARHTSTQHKPTYNRKFARDYMRRVVRESRRRQRKQREQEAI